MMPQLSRSRRRIMRPKRTHTLRTRPIRRRSGLRLRPYMPAAAAEALGLQAGGQQRRCRAPRRRSVAPADARRRLAAARASATSAGQARAFCHVSSAPAWQQPACQQMSRSRRGGDANALRSAPPRAARHRRRTPAVLEAAHPHRRSGTGSAARPDKLQPAPRRRRHARRAAPPPCWRCFPATTTTFCVTGHSERFSSLPRGASPGRAGCHQARQLSSGARCASARRRIGAARTYATSATYAAHSPTDSTYARRRISQCWTCMHEAWLATSPIAHR